MADVQERLKKLGASARIGMLQRFPLSYGLMPPAPVGPANPPFLCPTGYVEDAHSLADTSRRPSLRIKERDSDV